MRNSKIHARTFCNLYSMDCSTFSLGSMYLLDDNFDLAVSTLEPLMYEEITQLNDEAKEALAQIKRKKDKRLDELLTKLEKQIRKRA